LIVGVDHLALNVTDLDAASQEFERRRFVRVFHERGVANHPAKRPLLANYEPQHDLALFVPPCGEDGIPVELVALATSLCGPSPFARLDGGLLVAVPDPAAEAEFWCTALGFRIERPLVMRLASPVPTMACRCSLVEGPPLEGYLLDCVGHPSVAFHSTNLVQDGARAAEAGATDITPVFSIQVNGRWLDILLFRTPAGAIVELLRTRRSS